MKKSTIVAVTALALALAGCVTPYQAAGFRGGFSETQLAEDIFRINFKGNGYSSIERVQDFTLLRCAEIAQERGFPYFVIIGGSSQSTTAFVPGVATSQTSMRGTVSGNQFKGTGTTQTYGGGMAVSKPTNDNTIKLLKEKPSEDVAAYESRFVVQSIRNKYASEFGAKDGEKN